MHEPPPYDLEIDRVVEEIKARGARRVLIQLPDGLKHYYEYLREEIIKRRGVNVEIILSGSPCYGGCYVVEDEARLVGADLIVHYGHTRYYNEGYPTIYVPARSLLELDEDLYNEAASTLEELGHRRVGLEATIQHVHLIDRAATALKSRGFKVYIGRVEGVLQVSHPGQVIGCNYAAAVSINHLVDCHLIICGGSFHPVGLGLATGKPVIKIDPYERRVKDYRKHIDRVLRIRYGKIMKAMNAKTFGVIAGDKPGQYRPKLIREIVRMIREKGLKHVLVVLGETSINTLRNVDTNLADAWIVTSCPRLAIDDLSEYEKPVLTPGEARMVLKGELERYIFP